MIDCAQWVENSQSALFASGQCVHYFVRNGHQAGKQRYRCVRCRFNMTEGVPPKIDPVDRAIQMLPYFRRGLSLRRTARSVRASTKFVKKTFLSISKHLPWPICRCGRPVGHKGNCLVYRESIQ